MKAKMGSPKSTFTLIPNRGWKKNLLSVVISVLLCFALAALMIALNSLGGGTTFDISNAILPFFGFIFGIWWVIGYLLYVAGTIVLELLVLGPGEMAISSFLDFFISVLPVVIYSMLPAVLWYFIPLKGENKPGYPRLDTAAHVIKLYLIMIVSIAVYVLIMMAEDPMPFDSGLLLGYIYWFMQYLDITLIVGIPLLIVVSLVRNRTLTINERMVLAFLVIGIAAAAMGAFFMYLNARRLDPSLFKEYERLFEPNIENVTDELIKAYERYVTYWNRFYVMTAIMLNGLLIIEMAFMRSIEKKVTLPVLHLAKVLEEYSGTAQAEPEETGEAEKALIKTGKVGNGTESGEDGLAAQTLRLNPQAVIESCRPYRYGYGEISSLTRTCIDMVGSIDTYTNNLRQVTAEKERIGAELDVASKIQRDMLPGVFPPFPDRTEFDLFASMKPAKEVGGDFYDFYFIDNDHLALTIADVSGKGVPAALFMVISKTLLKNEAQTGASPKQVLSFVNHQLCQNNESMMFCTVWLGILDLTTGKLTASNGGHEYPAVRRKGGNFELMERTHDPALGVFDGLRFREYELTLEPGDTLFVYTDGVPEAENTDQEQLGEERMIASLNTGADAGPQELIGRMHEDIQAFAGAEPQFDDITMLCLKYLGKAGVSKTLREELTVPATADSLDEVTQFITQQLEAAGCPDDILFTISLSVEEIFVNIANYAYEGAAGDATILYSFNEKMRLAEITFIDSGLPFDPTLRPAPDITLAPEQRQIGGLGIYIVKKTMDEVVYQYAAGKNMLTIRKYL